jgi:hypothetical protein
MCVCKGPGFIDEVVFLDDWGWWHAVDDCAEFEEEIGFLDCLIGWHASIRLNE